jgi:hypothetical protein
MSTAMPRAEKSAVKWTHDASESSPEDRSEQPGFPVEMSA